MPRVIVIASPSERDDGAMMLSERVTVADLDSGHFAAQLIDRLRWAVADAHLAEQTQRALGRSYALPGHCASDARASSVEDAPGRPRALPSDAK